MQLKVITIDKNYPNLNSIKKLYHDSFPRNERAPFKSLIKRLNKQTDFLAFYDDDLFVGFTYLVTMHDLTYLFYFVVDEPLRNKGYGSAILAYLEEQYTCIFIDIEVIDVNALNYTQRLRRRDFYLRNHFKETGLGYSFFKVDYEILAFGKGFSTHHAQQLFYDFTSGFMNIQFKKITL
ncbi:MAG: GNAT family N-acetyltransferase [Erysipelotrichaceae bacterium]|nr:GNAT family N-acetyltransferase [Erysipelotrichaceae bacterium]